MFTLRCSVLIAAAALPALTACRRERVEAVALPSLPRASSPVTLSAVTDSATGLSRFRFQGVDTPPVIHVSPGRDLVVDYKNRLSPTPREPCIVAPCTDASNLHFHGLHVSPQAPQDDEITMMSEPGQDLHYTVQVPPRQPPGLYWYHTHPHHESYRQDLDGMTGAIVVDGMDRYLPALRGMEERILVLRDRILDDSGPTRERLLQTVDVPKAACGSSDDKLERIFTVNGAVRPSIGIAPGEKQFWRIVNTSPDLYADVAIPGSTLEVVALDGMPLAFHDPDTPTRAYGHVLLPPAGRVEAVVTGAGTARSLVTRCFDTGKAGDPNPSMVLADMVPAPQTGPRHTMVETGGTAVHQVVPAATLSAVQNAAPQFTVVFSEDKHGFYINGQKYAMGGPPMLTVQTGLYRHWRVVNDSDEVHPFHIHQVHFLAYRQNGSTLLPPVWLDIVNVPARGSVDLVMDFTDPIIRGTSLFHCHLLKHEDKGMMATIVFR